MTPRVPSSIPDLSTSDGQSIVGPYGPFGGEPPMVPAEKPFDEPPLHAPSDNSATPSGVDTDAAADLVGQYLEGLRGAARAIGDAFNQLVEGLNAFGPMPAEVVARVQEVLAEVRKMIERVFSTIEEVLRRQAPFAALILTSGDWVRNVQGPMRTMASEVVDGEPPNLAYWEGVAKNVYEERRTRQQKAMNDVGDAARFISDWLMKIAKQNVAWLVRLLELETAVAARIAEAALSARSDPEGFMKALKEVLMTLITDAANELIGATTRITESADDARKVAQHIADMGMGNGWPQAVRG